MNRSRKRHGDPVEEDDFNPNERFDRLERMGEALHSKINSLLRAANIDFLMEIRQMADFTALNAKVSKMSDLAASFKTMTDGLKAERDAARDELAAVKAADQVDQDAVNAAEAKLAEVTAALEAITAVATGTPVGGSVGGNTEPTI